MVLLGKGLVGLRGGFLVDYARYLTQIVLFCKHEFLVVVLWLVGLERVCVQVGAGRVVGMIVLVKFLLSLQAGNMAFWELDRELQCNQSLCLDGRGGGGRVPEGKQEHHLAH